jgi:hypothetical protein
MRRLMLHPQNRPNPVKTIGITVAGALALVITAGMLAAQVEDNKGKDKVGQDDDLAVSRRRYKKPKTVRLGYTRPGVPDDYYRDGKLISRVWEPKKVGERIIGGTVYFAVFEQLHLEHTDTGVEENDTYGVGISSWDKKFAPGRATNGSYSPAFDTKARYLYLYMVVNDRGLNPLKTRIKPALDKELPTEDITTTTVGLHVDLKEFTSWGYWDNTAFSAVVPNRNLEGDIRPTKLGGGNDLRLAFSADPSILVELPDHEYKKRAPALSLGDLDRGFGIAKSNLNLEETAAYIQLSKVAKPVAWQTNFIKAAKGGLKPDYVRLVSEQEQQQGKLSVDANKNTVEHHAKPGEATTGFFQAEWRGDNAVKLGTHSVIYGYTSNLPPVDEICSIYSPPGDPDRIPKDGNGGGGGAGAGAGANGFVNFGGDEVFVQAQGQAPGAANGQMVAPGTGPSPTPAAAGGGGGGGGGGGIAGSIGGGGAGGGSGFSPAFPGTGGYGTGLGTTGTGGGTGAASGGGQGNQGQTGTQTNGNNTGTDKNAGTQTQTLTFNPVLTNQQKQQQQQQQQQQQKQRQNQRQGQHQNNNNNHGQVVPEPAAIGLALLGLPALYLVLRRRKAPKPEAVPA